MDKKLQLLQCPYNAKDHNRYEDNHQTVTIVVAAAEEVVAVDHGGVLHRDSNEDHQYVVVVHPDVVHVAHLVVGVAATLQTVPDNFTRNSDQIVVFL